MIIVEDLSKHYDRLIAVDQISFQARPGEVFGLLGPNGAGKTSTIKILTGQIKPTAGKGTVAGYDIHRQSKLVKKNIGVVFEAPNLYERLTVGVNLEFFRELLGVPSQRVDEVLELVALRDRKKTVVSKLSKGLRQRVLIARALLAKPKVLFLDEPTNGLDPVSAQSIRNLILNYKSQGHTIFLTTHYMEEADQLCDQVAFIRSGKIEALDHPGNLKRIFGASQVEVTYRKPEGINTLVLDLKHPETGTKLKEMIEKQQLFSVHSREASLSDVFIEIAEGRKIDHEN